MSSTDPNNIITCVLLCILYYFMYTYIEYLMCFLQILMNVHLLTMEGAVKIAQIHKEATDVLVLKAFISWMIHIVQVCMYVCRYVCMYVCVISVCMPVSQTYVHTCSCRDSYWSEPHIFTYTYVRIYMYYILHNT